MSYFDYIFVVRFFGFKIKICLNGLVAGYIYVYIKIGKYLYV